MIVEKDACCDELGLVDFCIDGVIPIRRGFRIGFERLVDDLHSRQNREGRTGESKELNDILIFNWDLDELID